MPYRRALDSPGSWHHVMNRAVAKRTMFEQEKDVRVFLAAIGREVRAGEIELHAYTVMHTHFHLLVRSCEGRLADAMQRIQLSYVHYFNRGRDRDGPLVRGRYRSKLVRSIRYRKALVAYIDSNPVAAHLAVLATEYPRGSAFHYCRPSGPAWLERSWVESVVRAATGESPYDPGKYPEVFGRRVCESLRRVVAARIESGSLEDPLDELLDSPPESLLAWMRSRAMLADGTRPCLPLCDLETVATVLEDEADSCAILSEDGSTSCMRAGLCSQLTGATQAAIASSMEFSLTWTSILIREHRRRIVRDEAYAAHAAGLARKALGVWASL